MNQFIRNRRILKGYFNLRWMSNLIGLVSIIICIYIFFDENTISEGYKYISMLPLLFGMFSLFSRIKKHLGNDLIITFFYLVLFIKYTVVPILMTISNNYIAGWVITTPDQRFTGTIIMICELAALLITTELYLYKFKIGVISPIKDIQIKSNTIYIICILIGFIGLIIFPTIREQVNFISIKSLNYSNMSTVQAIFNYFAMYVQVWFFIISLKKAYFKKLKGKRYNIFFVCLFAILNFAIIWGANRLTVLRSCIISLFVIAILFREKSKKIMLLMLIVSITIVIFMTGYRLVGSSTDAYLGDFIKLDNLTTDLQRYFAGPDTYAASVGVKETYDNLITYKTFVIDTVGKINFIRQLPWVVNNKNDSTYFLYDYYIGNNNNSGQIVPMAGQAYIHFGLLLSPIFSIITTILFFKSVNLANKQKDIGMMYSTALLAMNLAMFPMYNYSLILQQIMNVVIPLLFITYINIKITKQT